MHILWIYFTKIGELFFLGRWWVQSFVIFKWFEGTVSRNKYSTGFYGRKHYVITKDQSHAKFWENTQKPVYNNLYLYRYDGQWAYSVYLKG